MFRLAILLLVISGAVNAHEMVPTYPKITETHISGLCVTTLELFNRRSDIEYYKVEVHDAEWNTIPFATNGNPMKVRYLNRKTFDVYVRDEDVPKVTYICTTSLIPKESKTATAVSSRVCSKVVK